METIDSDYITILEEIEKKEQKIKIEENNKKEIKDDLNNYPIINENSNDILYI